MKSLIRPQLFIITGSNGAGKSTYKQELFPIEFNLLEIFDGDLFYTNQNTAFYRQTRSSKESRKLAEEALEKEFLRLVEQKITKRENFAYEGHFTGAGAWKIPERFKAEGFGINLIFCGLNTIIKSVLRVKSRVEEGGFHVPQLDIENNYWGNMTMLDKNFAMFDSVEIIDTSESLTTIARLEFGIPIRAISTSEIPYWVQKGMPTIFGLIENSES